MLIVTPSIALDEKELEENFIHSTGPGCQNINKVASAIQLKFDVLNSKSIPDEIKKRLMKLAGNKRTKDGAVIITARRFREREKNRRDARLRLVKLIQQASKPIKKRKPTSPSLASKQKRLVKKRRRGIQKRLRGNKPQIDE